MIILGGSRRNAKFFARHLVRTDQNERVTLVEIRGLLAEDIPSAFREMKAVAIGTRCLNFFYHAAINPRTDDPVSVAQWQFAVDVLERNLGLADQPRFVVQHAKNGRVHQHVVWSRINVDTMTAISDSLTYGKHEQTSRELELAFAHEPVDSVLVKDRETKRPQRGPRDWETFRAQESKIDPKALSAELTALWNASDSGSAFAAAIGERGFILTRGDRGYCVVDRRGDEHSLARRIQGVKAAGVRARMADVDLDALPSVDEGRALARTRWEADAEADSADGGATPQNMRGEAAASTQDAAAAPEAVAGDQASQETAQAVVAPQEDSDTAELAEGLTAAGEAPQEPAGADMPEDQAASQMQVADAPVEAIAEDTDEAESTDADPMMEELLALASTTPEGAVDASDYDLPAPSPDQSPASADMDRELLQLALRDQLATAQESQAERVSGRFERVQQWWSNMRQTLSGWRDHVRERASHFLSRWDREEMQHEAQQDQVPEPASQSAPPPRQQPDQGVDLTP